MFCHPNFKRICVTDKNVLLFELLLNWGKSLNKLSQGYKWQNNTRYLIELETSIKEGDWRLVSGKLLLHWPPALPLWHRPQSEIVGVLLESCSWFLQSPSFSELTGVRKGFDCSERDRMAAVGGGRKDPDVEKFRPTTLWLGTRWGLGGGGTTLYPHPIPPLSQHWRKAGRQKKVEIRNYLIP